MSLGLPPGVINSAELFMQAIKTGGAAPQHEFGAEAILFLEKQFKDTMRKIDLDYATNEEHYLMVFWTGALLGQKIALRGYINHLKALAQEQGPAKEPS